MRRSLKQLFIAAGVNFMTSGLHAAEVKLTPPLHLDGGELRGVEQGDMDAYLGIPYAKPPVGPLRWIPPQKTPPWKTPYGATKLGNFCAQNAELGVFGKAGGSEDCLYLNVYRSKDLKESDKTLPVLFWIHGGSLWVGASNDYDPGKLVTEGKAIVVTFNYRLGMFGFFAHPAIDREGHAFANYGMLDQQFAMDWVQRNIAAFGGDPTNVTIFGESSGGNSVLSQMASPGSAGKFQHAIAMSGATVMLKHPAFGSTKPLDFAEQKGSAFAEKMGCSGNEAAACLRRLSTSQILKVQAPYLINQAIVDGVFLPMTPADAFKSGKFNRVTLINGTTRDEGNFFAGFPENETGIAMTVRAYPTVFERFYGKSLAQKALKEYPISRYNTPSEGFAAAVTDSQFACPARAVNQWAESKTPVFAYEFADRTAPSYLKPTTFPLGAAHTSELAYLFPGFHGGNGLPVKLNALQKKLADQIVSLWSGAGALTSDNSAWPRYNKSEDNYMRLILPAAEMESGNFNETHHCAFWDQTGIY